MRVSGKVISRCEICRKAGTSGFSSCQHRGKRKYIAEYRINGKRRREVAGFNKSIAEKRLMDILNSIHDGSFFEDKSKNNTSFFDFSKKWLKDYAKPRVKRRTYATYEGYIRNHLTPCLKDAGIANITEEDISGLLSTLLEKIGPSTVNKVLTMMKTMFKYAKRWKYRDDNPAWDIDRLKEDHKEMDFLNPEEIRLLLENSREPFRTLFLTATFTGMRSSEILALQWGDIDWHGSTIHVRRSLMKKTKDEVKENESIWGFDSPKSKKSKRAIIMSPKLKASLEKHRFDETVRLAQIKKDNAAINPDELVFTNKEGNPIHHENMVKREFNPSLASAGLRRVRFHDLRHTFASLLINQGENIKFIQSQLGHASIQTTIDRYGHLLPIKNYSNVGSRLDQNVFLDTYGIHVVNEQQQKPQNKK